MFSVSRTPFSLILTLFAVLLTCVNAVRSPLKLTETLVLYDPAQLDNGSEFTSEYSKFTKILNDRGFDADIKSINDLEKENIKLSENGYLLYQNLFIFPTKVKELSSSFTSKELVDFVNLGGDIFAITKPSGSQTDVVLFLNELGIYPSPKSYKFVDYFNQSDDNELGTEYISNPDFSNEFITPTTSSIAKLPFSSGSVALISNNEFLVPVLRASRTSVTYNPDEGINSKSTWHSGSQGFLITGFQASNNARVMWSGSDDYFKDSQFNEELVTDLINWTFQISGLVKITSFKHENSETKYSENYKVKDQVDFEIGFSKWDGEAWVKYEAPEGSEIQLEFTMLNPYYRLTLQKMREEQIGEVESSIYGVSFQIPDQHGMFAFDVDYKIPGLSYVEAKEVVPVRHFANDEYPRSWEITNSWVYLVSSMAVVVAWFFFVAFYILSGKDQPTVEAEKKLN